MGTQPLARKVALVAGATRGAGRGIATALGEAGATVYCTGRSVPGSPGMAGRPETVQETADVTARGGRGPTGLKDDLPGAATFPDRALQAGPEGAQRR
jgi:NAD(P)-dependent dehydrogenase (short-subunit alcohol dehydrogenase family)